MRGAKGVKNAKGRLAGLSGDAREVGLCVVQGGAQCEALAAATHEAVHTPALEEVELVGTLGERLAGGGEGGNK